MTLGPRPAYLAIALDNDVLNDWRFGKQATLQAIGEYLSATKAMPALTSITVFEMMHGFEKAAVIAGSMTEQIRLDLERARTLTGECGVLDFNREAAEIAAYIFPRLSQKEQKKHRADVMVVATALAHEHGVATRNRSDFELISKHTPPNYPTLRLHIWK
jgi:predicted nucleic acid-binding protein